MQSQLIIDEKVYIARVKLFFLHTKGNVRSVSLIGVLIGFLLWTAGVSETVVLFWLAGIFVTGFITFSIESRFKTAEINIANAKTWLVRRMLAGGTVLAFFGLSPFLIPAEAGITYILVLFIVLLGIFSITCLAYSIIPAFIFMVDGIVLGPITLWFLSNTDTINLTVALLSVTGQFQLIKKSMLVSKSAINELYAKEQLHNEIAERKRLEEELKYHATTDTLTGIANRRAGMLFLEKQIQIAKRNKTELCVCFIDINNLKVVNDTYGHEEGDKLIRLSSEVMQESLRESEFICRLGGDEFLIIFPLCSIKSSLKIWKRVETELDEINKEKVKPYSISMSKGFAECGPENMRTPDEMISIADQEMYKNKHQDV